MKSKKKTIIISIIAVIIVGIIAFASIYLATDIFKTPKQLFLKYMSKQVASENQMSYTALLEKMESNKNKSYTLNSDIALNIESDEDSFSTRKTEEAYEIINKIKFKMEQTVNPKENNSYSKLNAEYDGKEMATIELVQNSDKYAIKSDYIDEDKYIALENKNLKEFFKKLGVDDEELEAIPDQITTIDLYEFLYISKEDQKSIVNTYKKFLNENITDDKFKVSKNENITINNKETATTKYELELSEKDIMNIMNNFFETLKKDDTTLNLIVDKYNKYVEESFASIGMKSYQKTNSIVNGDSEEITLTKEKLLEYIEELSEDIKDEIEDASESSMIKIAVYQSKGKVYRTEITKDEDRVIAVDYYENDGRNYIEFTVPTAKRSSYSRYNRKNVKVDNKIIIDYVLKKEKDETNIEGNIKVIQDTEEAISKFNITTKGEFGKGINETNMELSSTVEGNTIKLNLNNTIEYKNDVEIINLNDNADNVITLNDMSKEEMSKLFGDIAKKFQQKVTKKAEELGFTKSSSSLYEDLDYDELEDTDSEDEDIENVDEEDEEDDM